MKRRTAMRKVLRKGLKFPGEFLYGVDGLLEYSFIVHKSLDHLDISRWELTRFKREEKRKRHLDEKTKRKKCFDEFHLVATADKFIDTEEACRKKLAPNRKLLYKYHLDVSKDLELNLRNPDHKKIIQCYSDGVLLNSLVVFDNEMCESFLNNMILETLERTNQKVRLIHHVSKLAKSLEFISENKRIRDKCLTYLCFQRADSSIVNEFLTVMEFDIDHLFTFSVHVFEFVLHHATQTGYDLWSGSSSQDPIHTSINYNMFVKTESLFQYLTAPKFCKVIYHILQDGSRWSLPDDALKFPEENGLLTKERHLLILEILRVFWCEPSNGLKALQMVWRSIPDPFISLDELTLALARHPNPENITAACNFIKNVTGEDVREESGHQPRKLEHYCRILIRRVLDDNKLLSSGITKLNLPPSLKSFLRLEK